MMPAFRKLLNVFPARAGMSPPARAPLHFPLCVPRASGDEPKYMTGYELIYSCSPRERG